MPLPLAFPVAFLIGLALAWAGREEFRKEDQPFATARPVRVAAAFALFVYVPVVAYFVTFHGDWAYLYVFPWRRIPSALDLALVILSGAVVPLSTLLAAPATRLRRLGTLLRLGAAPAVLALGLLAWGARRLAVSATYAQYHGDFGIEPLVSSALGRGLLWMGLVMALGIAWSVRRVR